ncbi:hypothetical protein [Anaerobacillus arseniciselenatis]|nr:hypothetical protein [Anaerobacillus arseniciselenatis]
MEKELGIVIPVPFYHKKAYRNVIRENIFITNDRIIYYFIGK